MKYLVFKHLTEKRLVALAMLLALQLVAGFHVDVNAQSVQSAPVLITDANQAQTKFIGILCKVMNWMFSILIVLSVVMVLVAAYMYVTAGGNSEKVSSATKIITYAAVGVVVALFARGLPIIVASVVGANVSDVCGGAAGGSSTGGGFLE